MARNPKLVSDPMVLEAALEGLELQRQRIDEQIRQVRSLLGKRKSNASKTTTSEAAAPKRRRQLSPAARKRIAAAQKKRWAEYRKSAGEG